MTLVVRSSCNLARVKIDCCDCSALSARLGEFREAKLRQDGPWQNLVVPSDVAEFRSFLDRSPSKIYPESDNKLSIWDVPDLC